MKALDLFGHSTVGKALIPNGISVGAPKKGQPKCTFPSALTIALQRYSAPRLGCIKSPSKGAVPHEISYPVLVWQNKTRSTGYKGFHSLADGF